MIASLRGVVIAKDKESLILECAGVGYEVHVTASAAGRLPPPGGEVSLLVESSFGMYGGGQTLYGFLTPAEKMLFRVFRDEISGTGAKKALEYLDKASKSLPDFRRAVIERDEKMLCAVFGFTKKSAAKLTEALKEKLAEVNVPGIPRIEKTLDGALPSGPWAQALSALSALGYRPTEARAALQALAEEHEGREQAPEQLVRQALKRL